MTRDEAVARARSAIGKGTTYAIGAGGRHPDAVHPGMQVEGVPDSPHSLLCDCSGFVAWCLGVDRYLPNDGIKTSPFGDWFETTALAQDAKSPPGIGFVDEVPWADAKPADMLVWGDRKGTDGKVHQGHVGLVCSIGPKGPETVAHCSLGNFHATGDAIQETDCGIFVRNGAIVARVAWITD